jgi:hypothetical protein
VGDRNWCFKSRLFLSLFGTEIGWERRASRAVAVLGIRNQHLLFDSIVDQLEIQKRGIGKMIRTV